MNSVLLLFYCIYKKENTEKIYKISNYIYLVYPFFMYWTINIVSFSIKRISSILFSENLIIYTQKKTQVKGNLCQKNLLKGGQLLPL